MIEKVNGNKMCDVGDILYRIKSGEIIIIKVIKAEQQELGHYAYRDYLGFSFFNRNFGKNIFKTEEEAKEKLNTQKLIEKKRKMLREYERQLNKELGIEFHLIIK